MSLKRTHEVTDDEVNLFDDNRNKKPKTISINSEKDDDNINNHFNLIVDNQKDITDYTNEEIDDLYNTLLFLKPNKFENSKHLDNLIKTYPKHIQSLYNLFMKSEQQLTMYEYELISSSYSKPWFDYIVPKLQYDFDKYMSYNEKINKLESHISDSKCIIQIMEKLCSNYIKQYYIATEYDPSKLNEISCKYHKIKKKITVHENNFKTLCKYRKLVYIEYTKFMETRSYLNSL